MNSMAIALNPNNIPQFISNMNKNATEYRVGASKIFLKKHTYEDMVLENKRTMFKNAIIIQKYVRCWFICRKYMKFIKIVKLFQNKWRTYLIKKHKAQALIYKVIHGYFVRKNYLLVRKNIIINTS